MDFLAPRKRLLFFADLGFGIGAVLFVSNLLSGRFADGLFYGIVFMLGGSIAGIVVSRYWPFLIGPATAVIWGIVPYLDYRGYHISEGIVAVTWTGFGIILCVMLLVIFMGHLPDYRDEPRWPILIC